MTTITPDVITDIATGAIKPIDAFHLFDDLIGEATVLVNRTNNAEQAPSEEYLCAALKTHVLTVIRNVCDELITCNSDRTVNDAFEANPQGGAFAVSQAPDTRFRWYLTAKHDLSDARKKGFFADMWRTWNKFEQDLQRFMAQAKYYKRDAIDGYIHGDPDLGIPRHENYVPAEEFVHVDCLSAKIFEDDAPTDQTD